MNELLNLRAKDELTGKVYNIVGFNITGDDRTGFNVSSISLYDPSNRLRHIINNPIGIKRLTLIRE